MANLIQSYIRDLQTTISNEELILQDFLVILKHFGAHHDRKKMCCNIYAVQLRCINPL